MARRKVCPPIYFFGAVLVMVALDRWAPLQRWLAGPARYVGLVGARRKTILVAERLLADGFGPERVRALRSPIGLDIGARTPEEIALSIVGEWIMLRQGGSGTPLQLGAELFDKAAARAGAGAPRAGGTPGA